MPMHGMPPAEFGERVELAELTAKKRKRLPDAAFALPGRRYPIHDAAHARNALARVAQHGTPAEQKRVRAAVRKRFPTIDVGGSGKPKAKSAPARGRRGK
jgi:outer membrane protein TolC